jgi:hypothetical protein
MQEMDMIMDKLLDMEMKDMISKKKEEMKRMKVEQKS